VLASFLEPEPLERRDRPLSELESDKTLSVFMLLERLSTVDESAFGTATGEPNDAFDDGGEYFDFTCKETERALDADPRRFSVGARCCSPARVDIDGDDSAAAARLGLLTGGWLVDPPSASVSLRLFDGGVVRKPSMRFRGVSPLPDRRTDLSPTEDDNEPPP